MNQIYPKFLANCLGAVLSGSGPDSVPNLYFYALTTGYVYNPSHELLAQIPEGNRIAKSKVVAGNISGEAVVSIPPLVDAFESAEMTNVGGLVLVAEFAGESRLVFYMNMWENTGLPFTAPAQVNISFIDDFVFRLGNVGPVVGGPV